MAQMIRPIGVIENGYQDKFGIPRQSGLAKAVVSRIVFEPDYRSAEAFRGLEGFSHLWLIWGFSQARRRGNPLTVRPPRLGGNIRMGVFATRSPFRPNSLGLSCVSLEKIEQHPRLGTVLHVGGADLMNGTPIYDVKPYLPFADCRPDARGGLCPGGDGSAADRRHARILRGGAAAPGALRPDGNPGPGSPPRLSGGPGASLRRHLRRLERAFLRGRRGGKGDHGCQGIGNNLS